MGAPGTLSSVTFLKIKPFPCRDNEEKTLKFEGRLLNLATVTYMVLTY